MDASLSRAFGPGSRAQAPGAVASCTPDLRAAAARRGRGRAWRAARRSWRAAGPRPSPSTRLAPIFGGLPPCDCASDCGTAVHRRCACRMCRGHLKAIARCCFINARLLGIGIPGHTTRAPVQDEVMDGGGAGAGVAVCAAVRHPVHRGRRHPLAGPHHEGPRPRRLVRHDGQHARRQVRRSGALVWWFRAGVAAGCMLSCEGSRGTVPAAHGEPS